MPSNARMTFRFEPAKPKLPDRPAERPTMRIAESADKPAEALESRTAYPDIEIVGTPGMPMELAEDEIYVERNPPRADDFAAWDSPYQDDIRALEEMIRKSGSDTPAQPGKTSAAPSGARRLSAPPSSSSASAFASRLFAPGARTEAKPERGVTGLIEIVEPKGHPYDDRNEDGRYEEPSFGGRSENGWHDSIGTTEIVRETGPSWGRVVLSVAGAIGTGVLFGYLVLGLFTGEPFFPGQSSPQSEPRAQATATAQGVAPRAQSANAPLVGETEDGSPAVAEPDDLQVRRERQADQAVGLALHHPGVDRPQLVVRDPVDGQAGLRVPAGQGGVPRPDLARAFRHADEHDDLVAHPDHPRIERADDLEIVARGIHVGGGQQQLLEAAGEDHGRLRGGVDGSRPGRAIRRDRHGRCVSRYQLPVTDGFDRSILDEADMNSEHPNKTGASLEESTGPVGSTADIREHMEVYASCGTKIGLVDHVEGDAIKLTRRESPDGRHHRIPLSWVAKVHDHIHLNKDHREVESQWQPA